MLSSRAVARGLRSGNVRAFSSFHSNNWNYPSKVRFGEGRISELPDACKELGMSNPLVVTDPGLINMPMVQDAVKLLQSTTNGCGTFSEIQGNPVEANVTGGIQVYRQGGHDGIVAFGGGSAQDVAKAIALMVNHNGSLWDFEDGNDAAPYNTIVAPVVAVPTTSGTGSEVGRASVITDVATKTKKIIFHPNLMPPSVILDPVLTTGLPKFMSAAVGIDALSHCMEALYSPVYHPMAHGMAIEGIRLIKDWLPAVCEDGQNVEARAHLQVASTMGATAFQKGLGAMHGMSHPLGAVLDVHHGLSNAIVMPYVMEFNRPQVSDKSAALARYLNLDDQTHTGLTDWVLGLRDDLSIPNTLQDVNMNEEHVGLLAPMAVVDPSSGTNPVPVTLEAATALYSSALTGKL